MPSDQPAGVPSPKRQRRGLRRIESILDAAEEVIAEQGYDATTTNQVAARAGISPGSLYQYFVNKAAIVEALSRRYLSHLTEQSEGGVFVSGLGDLPHWELVNRVVDPLLAFNLAHPAATSLLAGVDLSPELAASTRELHTALCDSVEILIGELAPARSAAERQLAATMSIQIFASTLPAVMAASPRVRPLVVRELKAALGGYWEHIRSGG